MLDARGAAGQHQAIDNCACLGSVDGVAEQGAEQEQFKILRGLYQPKTVKSL